MKETLGEFGYLGAQRVSRANRQILLDDSLLDIPVMALPHVVSDLFAYLPVSMAQIIFPDDLLPLRVGRADDIKIISDMLSGQRTNHIGILSMDDDNILSSFGSLRPLSVG